MSFGESEGGDIGFETMQGRSWPSITQYSVFLENRVGQLLEVLRAFHGSKVKIAALMISDSADCSILRLILSHPEQGREILSLNKLSFAENELLVVELPAGPGSLVDVCTSMLQGEINIFYSYPTIVHPHGRPALVLHVDNNEQASAILRARGLEILCEADLAG
jgi:hypothetical protein